MKDLGIQKGDVVGIYMGMIPEVVVAMLACARIGAVHNVVFGGFSAESVRERMEFSEAKALITVDGAARKGKIAPIKQQVDAVMGDLEHLEHIIVVQSKGTECEMKEGRDVWYHEIVAAAADECPAEPMDAEDPLFILYTSGSTAKPKGILHTTGGYLTGASSTHQNVFDIHAETDTYWCCADVGWITGHTYIVYGPLANGATRVMYEGAPDYPHRGSGGSSSSATRRRSSTRRRRRSAPSSSGARSTPGSTTSHRCGCSARSVSRSTRRRGSGTTR